MYELIIYLKFYVKSEKTFQRLFKRLIFEKLVHNILTFYRFNNHLMKHDFRKEGKRSAPKCATAQLNFTAHCNSVT
jgi:hypothetical protein